MPNSRNNKMTEQDILTRLREYRTFLETQQKDYKEKGKKESVIGSISADARTSSYSDARQKLEEIFPELYIENLTQIIDGVQGEEADSLDSPIGLRQLSEE